MKNHNKKLLALLLAFAFAAALPGLNIPAAMADINPDREFSSKYDTVFEDFDRESITTVTTAGDVVDSGKAYLSVPLSATNAGDADNGENIYKSATPTGEGATRGNLVFIVRSPNGAAVGDLMLGLRYINGVYYNKSLSGMVDGDANPLPAIGTGWTKLMINFANSFESSEKYSNDVSVAGGVFVGFHLYTAQGVSGKTLEINNIYFTTDGTDVSAVSRKPVNNFIGGATLLDCAKAADSGTYWAGSSGGSIVKRTYTVNAGGELQVVNEAKKGTGYGYAVVETTGTGAMTVSTTTDGTTWSAPAEFSRVFAVANNTSGFKFNVSSGSRVIKNIFFTNFQEDVIVTEFPQIDPATTQKFDDFSVDQANFTGDYEEMTGGANVKLLAAANLYYRLSYNNGNKVSVKDGALVFDAADIGNGYINFKTESKALAVGFKFVVFKVKGESGATLNGFRFGTGGAGAGTVDAKWGNGGLLSATGLPIPALDDESYPYTTEDGWKYLVIDMAESGLVNPAAGIAVMDIYYSGTGKLSIAEIFFANQIEYGVSEINARSIEFGGEKDGKEYTGNGDGYQDFGYAYVSNATAQQKYLKLNVSGTASLTEVRFEFTNSGNTAPFWFAPYQAVKFVDINGNDIPVDIPEGGASYIIDLEASGVALDFDAFHIHAGNIEAGKTFTLSGELLDIVPEYLAQTAIAFDNVTDGKEYEGNGDGYQYLGKANAPNVTNQYKYMELTVGGTASLTEVRFEFTNAGNTAPFWFAPYQAVKFVDINGNDIPLAIPEGGYTYIIDLEASGVALDFDAFHLHAGNITVGDTLVFSAKLIKIGYDYSELMTGLPVYVAPDLVDPTVTLTVPATATAGDVITVSYTVADDVSALADITVEVSVKKGSQDITLANGKFTAEEGTYTVTVTAIDEAGNETTEVKQIVVSAAVVPTPDPEGCESGCGSLMGAGGIDAAVVTALAGLMFVALFAAIKNRKGSKA